MSHCTMKNINKKVILMFSPLSYFMALLFFHENNFTRRADNAITNATKGFSRDTRRCTYLPHNLWNKPRVTQSNYISLTQILCNKQSNHITL